MELSDLLPPTWANDRFLVEMINDPKCAWHSGSGALVEHHNRHGYALTGVGEVGAVAHLTAARRIPAYASVTLPRGTWERLPRSITATIALDAQENWNWMDIEYIPEVPLMGQVKEIDLLHELEDFHRVRNSAIPDSFLTPNHPGVRWFGWYDHNGNIRAVGGAKGAAGGWPQGAHFGSIGTEPTWQGHGVGAALTSGMINIAFSEGATRASLGVYATNSRAIKLYERLGFETNYFIHSRSRGA